VFHSWSNNLPVQVEVVPVQLPGHGARLRESPLSQVSQIVQQLKEELEQLPPLPTALFGHSFGGLLAFELARALENAGNSPAFLCLSASRAAHLPLPGKPLRHLPDKEFLAEIGRMGGTPPEALEHEELMGLALPALRADLTAIETYQYQEGPRLTCPIYAIWGQEDTLVSQAEIEAWQEHTTGSFQLHLLADGHYYLETSRDELWGLLSKIIADLGL
jgi:medium-chain acyl-[acyl-carrier-protein] hydrolase